MNILVIGNGFDLAHGLPTKYGDFLDFVHAFKMYQKYLDFFNDSDEKQHAKKQSWLNYFKEIDENKNELVNEITQLINDNSWVKYFLELWHRKQVLSKEKGWIDFECEISKIIQELDEAYTYKEEKVRNGEKPVFSEGYRHLWSNIYSIVRYVAKASPDNTDTRKECYTSDFTLDDMNCIKKSLIYDLDRLTRLLEIYLSDYISYEKSEPLDIIKNLSIDRVLSFNYTDTYQRLYANSPESKVQYCFIHGKAEIDCNTDDCDLVLGIDEYLPEQLRDSNNRFVEFKKFYQRIYKMTSSQYIHWAEERAEFIKRMPKASNPPELNIYIYGHSLDVTDKDVLKKLILTEGAQTIIFYHSKEALGGQIANLVKVIGEEELIKRTGGNKRTIRFRPTF